MYTVSGDCPGNETLALRMQSGDVAAAELLLSQNEGYLTDLALEHSDWCEPEDLKQEGALALLEAAKHFDPAYRTKLLTYATPIIQSAMADYCAHASLSVSIPSARYQQLRKVARACYEAKDDSEETLMVPFPTILPSESFDRKDFFDSLYKRLPMKGPRARAAHLEP